MDDDIRSLISSTCDDIKKLLLDKNSAYGNSALEPIRVFSKLGPIEQLLVRIDDKLSRLSKGNEYPGEDTITDLIGYLVLLKIALSTPWTTTVDIADAPVGAATPLVFRRAK